MTTLFFLLHRRKTLAPSLLLLFLAHYTFNLLANPIGSTFKTYQKSIYITTNFNTALVQLTIIAQLDYCKSLLTPSTVLLFISPGQYHSNQSKSDNLHVCVPQTPLAAW